MSHQIRPAISTIPELSDEQFARWQALLEEKTGMCMPEQRRSFLQTSLGLRMREIECKDYDEYLAKVTAGPAGAIEWNTLVDRLTVQETRFFRDPDALGLVENHLRHLADSLEPGRTAEIWSVGCSSGEETYTLAMLAEKQLGSRDKLYAVTGTDISTFALRKARTALYPKSALNWIPDRLQGTGFKISGEHKVQVRDDIRQRCCFTQVNILDLKSFPLQSQHVIYCQNVLIYFRRWRRRQILNVLAERLVPGGILVIGLGEIVDWKNPLVEPIGGGKVTAFVRKQDDMTRET